MKGKTKIMNEKCRFIHEVKGERKLFTFVNEHYEYLASSVIPRKKEINAKFFQALNK